MTKYRECFEKMLVENKELFARFRRLHDYYAQNSTRYQLTYNIEGAKVVEVIRQYERRLCGHSEKGQYAKFSSNLADRFWQEVRRAFPKIDFIGVQRS